MATEKHNYAPDVKSLEDFWVRGAPLPDQFRAVFPKSEIFLDILFKDY